MTQCRLVDYVAIVGFDFDDQRNSKGKIIQRFPIKDWPDTSFIDSIELFCQPLGWKLTPYKQNPKFFQFVLTDIDADRHYCACLAFHEATSTQLSYDDLDDDLSSLILHQQQQQQSATNYDGQQPPHQSPPEHDTVDNNCNPTNNTTNIQTLNHATQATRTLYAPKCLVLISRYDYKEIFKNCLSILYSVHADNLRYSLENIVGNLLACVEVPPYGGNSLRFSLSAGDSQTLQTPLTESIPVTNTTVYKVFQHFSVDTVVEIFCALLTEQKILFFSDSYNMLNEICHGLIALMYPFKYSHIYIPILPAALIEVLSTPTPFIIGVHSSLKKEISDLLDVIIVDIESGSIKIPDSLHTFRLDEPYNSQLITLLYHITRPQFNENDDLVPDSNRLPSSPDILDKEIRAIFLSTITRILLGYRSCLTVIRIHPKPLITFHKASFLGQRCFAESEFMARLLDSMFFDNFVEARGIPYRWCDLFDDLHATIHERTEYVHNDIEAIVRHIKELAKSLWQNENPNPRPLQQKVYRPSKEGCAKGLILDGNKTTEIIENETIKQEMTKGNTSSESNSYTNNPLSRLSSQFIRPGIAAHQVKYDFNANELVLNSARRLEVMRNCVNCIFENKISDARKALPAVLKALKNKSARLALTQELSDHLGSQRAVLEHQQFDLVGRLMNCALQHESPIDVNGVAAKILPLAMEFCRRLGPGVIQFAYTDANMQDHPVWSSQQFWESSFYLDVQKDMQALYHAQSDNRLATLTIQSHSNCDNVETESIENSMKPSSSNSTNCSTTRSGSTDYTSGNNNPVASKNLTALEVAANQLYLASKISQHKDQQHLLDSHDKDEESTVYSQAVHYANRIVCMRIPLDVASRIPKSTNNVQPVSSDFQNTNLENSSQKTHSVNDSEQNPSNSDEESGFEDEVNGFGVNNSEVAAGVIKFVTRFVDKVCMNSSVGEEHIKALHQMIPQVVAMQIETLDSVYRESKRLPPVMKPKITNPNLIDGEELLMLGLRTYLLPDGRDKDNVKDETIGSHMGGPVLLPAEGAIFITNYRVIFRGRPCDPFYCEQTIVRSFPTTSLTKEKKITVHSVPAIEQYLQEGLQLRSNTFQLIRVAFDEEVSSNSIDCFRNYVNNQRWPTKMSNLFAFTSQIAIPGKSTILIQKSKNPKNATLKGFAKRTFLKTAQKAGLKKKDPNKNKYIFDGFSNGSRDSKTLGIGSTTSSSSIDNQHSSVTEENADSLNHSATSSDHSHHQSSLTATLPVSAIGSSTSVSSMASHAIVSQSHVHANTMDKLLEMNYVKDYFRLQLGNVSSPSPAASTSALPSFLQGSSKHHRTTSNSSNTIENFRITNINMNYSMTRSYPGLIVVPFPVSDDSLVKISRCYRHNRLPAITWRHSRTKALLVRASGFHAKGVISMLKRADHAASATLQSGTLVGTFKENTESGSLNEMSASIEQRKYFRALTSLTQIPQNDLTTAVTDHHDSNVYRPTPPNRNDHVDLGQSNTLLRSGSGGRRSPRPKLKSNALHRAFNKLTLRSSSNSKSGRGSIISNAMSNITSNGANSISSVVVQSKSTSSSNQYSHLTNAVGSVSNTPSQNQPKVPKRPGFLQPTINNQKNISENHNDNDDDDGEGEKGSTLTPFSVAGVVDPSPTLKPQRYALYIFAEKAQTKSIKMDSFPNCEFVPVELHEVRHVKSSFVKFLRACVPSAPIPPLESEQSLAKQIENSEWLNQLQAIIECSNTIVDLIDIRGSSVLLCLEDGWDLTPQITSVVQLCLDSYYRTFEGFRVLIEKEWLSFGHRFSHRSNHTDATKASGFAPLFLQFLDIVHQIHNQFPLSFEFNQYYLEFMAYHYVSCRFRTFLLDCESERAECGWINEEANPSVTSLSTFNQTNNSNCHNQMSNLPGIVRHSRQPSDDTSDITILNSSNSSPMHHQSSLSNNNVSSNGKNTTVYSSSGSQHNQQSSTSGLGSQAVDSSAQSSNNNNINVPISNTLGTSFWDYAEKLWNKAPIFFNYYYTPVNLIDPSKNIVLRPCSNMAALKIWTYYTSEELLHGPSYDLEVFFMEKQHQEEVQANSDMSQAKISKRRTVTSNYDNMSLTQTDGLSQAMSNIRTIEREYNFNSSKWQNIWSKIETSLPVD